MTSLKDNQLIARAKKLFKAFYNIPDGKNPKTGKTYLDEALDNYEGFNCATETEALARFCKFNIHYYYCPPYKEQYELVEEVVVDPSYPVKSLLRIPTGDGKFHIAVITDVEGLTGLRICPHCKSYCFNPRKQKNKKRFEQHVKECEANGGKLTQEVSLPYTQQPYAPHIQKQPVFRYLLAHDQVEKFRPTQYYITYDFETLEDPINEEITQQTTLDANLKPFMVSSTVKLPSGIETRNFCLANEGETLLING